MHEVSYITTGIETDFATLYPTSASHFFTSDGATHTAISDASLAEAGPGTVATFDILAPSGTSTYIIGDTADTQLDLTLTTEGVDWTTSSSLLEICGDYDTLLGSNVEEIYWGTQTPSSDSQKCQRFDFIVDESVAEASQVHRECFFCDGAGQNTVL